MKSFSVLWARIKGFIRSLNWSWKCSNWRMTSLSWRRACRFARNRCLVSMAVRQASFLWASPLFQGYLTRVSWVFTKVHKFKFLFGAFFARKFVAETEQKSMNRVLLSNSLREKELEKELWLLEAQLIGRSWRVYHLLPYICCLHLIKQWLAAQWIAQGQEICCVLLSYLYLLVQFHALFWHVEWPGDEDKLRGAAENAAARAWAAAKGKGCNH